MKRQKDKEAFFLSVSVFIILCACGASVAEFNNRKRRP